MRPWGQLAAPAGLLGRAVRPWGQLAAHAGLLVWAVRPAVQGTDTEARLVRVAVLLAARLAVALAHVAVQKPLGRVPFEGLGLLAVSTFCSS